MSKLLRSLTVPIRHTFQPKFQLVTRSIATQQSIYKLTPTYPKTEVTTVPNTVYNPDESLRSGLILRKVGMSCIWDNLGQQIPCTILKLDDLTVTQVKTEDNDGYNSVQLGSTEIEGRKLPKASLGKFVSAGLVPKRKLMEFKVDSEGLIPVGTNLNVTHFVAGQYVDVQAPSIGKGFQGGMKRHNFKGLRASHGVSLTHRSIGSTGQRAQPGKVFKGKKMPGRMGGHFVTVQNLKVVMVDKEKNLLYVKGAVPGHNNQFIKVTDAVKKIGLLKFGLSKQQINEKVGYNIPYPTVDPKILGDVANMVKAKTLVTNIEKK